MDNQDEDRQNDLENDIDKKSFISVFDDVLENSSRTDLWTPIDKTFDHSKLGKLLYSS